MPHKTPPLKAFRKAKRTETTSKKVASKAAKVLKDPKASKREKSLAASALTQKEPRVDRTSKLERFVAALREYYAAFKALESNPARKAKATRRR